MIYFRELRGFLAMENKIKRIPVIHRIIFVLNMLAALLLLTATFCCNISPAEFWPAELIAISYPYLLFLNILFVVFWIFTRYKYSLISIAAILFGYAQLTLLFQFNFKSPETKTENAFSIMSFNVRLFDLYNWTGNLKTRSEIFDQLKKEQPDIICFQEYYNSDKGDFQNTIALKSFLDASNAHVVYGKTMRKTDHWGLATFTKFPIVGKGKVLFEEGKSNFCLFTDMKIGDDTLRIYNLHLQSNHFKEKDYQFIESPDSGSNEQILQSSKSILNRLKEGAIKRAQQVDELRIHFNNSPYPIIVCGDFNDPPFSYVYNVLSEGLNDSFKSHGKGMGVTYIGKIPFFRIDNILYDDAMKCNSFEIPDVKLSDHRPVKATFQINKNTSE
jgi:endonuclease/exonuclease/phosphatase family metal-dependent hydrolase